MAGGAQLYVYYRVRPADAAAVIAAVGALHAGWRARWPGLACTLARRAEAHDGADEPLDPDGDLPPARWRAGRVPARDRARCPRAPRGLDRRRAAPRSLRAMCLIALALEQHPRYALVIAANRDEFLHRPAAALDWWQPAPAAEPVLGGRDLQAGGTWMGLSAAGRIALLTNVRDPSRQRATAPSRGAIVPAWLAWQQPVRRVLGAHRRSGPQPVQPARPRWPRRPVVVDRRPRVGAQAARPRRVRAVQRRARHAVAEGAAAQAGAGRRADGVHSRSKTPCSPRWPMRPRSPTMPRCQTPASASSASAGWRRHSSARPTRATARAARRC